MSNVGSTVLHQMVVRLRSTKDLWANSATCSPPSWSKMMDHIIYSFMYPFGQYNFSATWLYCWMMVPIPAPFFSVAWTSGATHLTCPLAIASINCLWSSSMPAFASSFQLLFSFDIHSWAIKSVFCQMIAISPPIPWYTRGAFSLVPFLIWWIMLV